MSIKIEDIIKTGETSDEKPSKPRFVCKLEGCNHPTESICKQRTLEFEHKKDCPLGARCNHFGSVRGFPEHALYKGLSPAEYLLMTRGAKK